MKVNRRDQYHLVQYILLIIHWVVMRVPQLPLLLLLRHIHYVMTIHNIQQQQQHQHQRIVMCMPIQQRLGN